ncbi:hypothetical protein IV203_010542 [Nitzschia inconspicua]|uniref:Uncharacterized protein n=1 Tax=Nitzschia inconspicua TaxID=303405 RepID=A0A9K3KWG6_9STRA|nr:hypothetical protein IV203_010542 [Nitzschia inconspicua]
MMKILLALFCLVVNGCTSFSAAPIHGRSLHSTTALAGGYVPDGVSPDEWRKLKEKERQDKINKDLGAYGPSTFKSRSLRAFQQDLEKGKTGHLMPMFNAKDKLKKGIIKPEDIPYMQRGGAWDNTDIKGAKKKEWSPADKTYNARWKPAKADWTGTVERQGPKSSKQPPKPQVKKLFGLF